MPKATDRQLLVIGDEHILVDPGKLLLGELVAAEKATGMSWPEIWVGVNRGQMQAVQAVVWLMRKRSNPKLRLSEVEFALEDYRMKDPDFDPDYWILEPGEEPPGADGSDDTSDDPETETEAPKAQDTVPTPEV